MPGEAVQPPPEPGQPSPYSQEILDGRWDINDAQDPMLDASRGKYNLQKDEWREHKK